MKKTILISLLIAATTLLGKYESTKIYKKQSSDKNKKSTFINITGKIYNISEYRDYYRVSIRTKKHGTIKTKMSKNYFRLKENQKVSGYCNNKKYGFYNCNIY